ncbi:MAG: ArsR family transcriptional regulator [Nitrosopumilus sp. CG10_big_fil_rev_8_21_14_0_10_33_7]|nr:MAG: ArsR family transcriptional regulator [Nitrosopumilales archaeon CG11_big_fil_rev_8_21_14_0_20_33_24]PIN97459.1 MAG: ArsR family transcriptional regulator [Nitrosopumilus sp. CG10_big_fil_rev_8_21_14_0_10_33_7]PIY90199.1 MAG: ArsR family transcriptional regulator [Nitrosopumilales archaeon CG_4_10_14_0_8_um_filter_34_8]PJB97515.1 MAG: ArsR family transcriptional regulator [Nitrosopumilales archaeon CG_4_9_14_0_8_um_filter_34_10]
MTDRTIQLQQIIDQNPGIQFREIMRSSGLKNGVLSHYLGKLEKLGVIKAVRGPRQARFYPPQITEDQSKAIKALRKQTPRDLLLALVKQDGLEFSELVSEVGKSPSTVSLYLSQLVEDKLVDVKLENLRKRYYIKTRMVIDQLIEDYRPGLLEKPTSGFEDIFNSL